MYITVDDIKNEILLINPIDNSNGDKKIGLIRAYFVFSFYNVQKDENIYLKNGEKLKVKKGCYTKRDIENVSAKKVRYNPLTGKSIIDPTISRFDPYMEKILGINNKNYIDTLLSKKAFSFKINKLSTTDNIFNSNHSDILYTEYLDKEISFGDIVYFEPNNIQYKKLTTGSIDQIKITLIDSDSKEISSNFKISIVLHVI